MPSKKILDRLIAWAPMGVVGTFFVAFLLAMSPAAGIPQPGAYGLTSKSKPMLSDGPGLVVLLTDFGEQGYLLGGLKGAIYGAGPSNLRIDAISNHISRFDVEEASVVLALGAESYPRGTIFVAMVSPDKSGPRPIVSLMTETGHIYLAPDNGILTQVALRYGVAEIHRVGPATVTTPGTSREILGPAAGAIAKGTHPRELGIAQSSLYLLQATPAKLLTDRVEGNVTLIDHFGNAFTNIQEAHLLALGIKPGGIFTVETDTQSLQVPWVSTYGDVKLNQPLALMSHHGELKLSINQGDLSKKMGIHRGISVVVKP